MTTFQIFANYYNKRIHDRRCFKVDFNQNKYLLDMFMDDPENRHQYELMIILWENGQRILHIRYDLKAKKFVYNFICLDSLQVSIYCF